MPDPPTAVTVIVEFPAGVVLCVETVRIVEQVGEHEFCENDPDTPVGNPEIAKPVACVVPEDNVAVIVFDTDCPLVTEMFPLFERLKLKAGVVVGPFKVASRLTIVASLHRLNPPAIEYT